MSSRIVLDNFTKIYWAGQTISGKIEIHCKQRKIVRKITINFKGFSSTQWNMKNKSGKQQTNQVTYGAENHFDDNLILLEGDGVEFLPGVHLYPFNLAFPYNTPSSFEGRFGKTKFTLQARVYSDPRTFETSSVVKVMALAILDLNYFKQKNKELYAEVKRKIGYCFWNQSIIHVVVTAPSFCYIEGDIIPLTIDIINQSSYPVSSIEVQIVRREWFKTLFPEKDSKMNDTVILKIAYSCVKARTDKTIDASIQIPFAVPSSTGGCTIIDIGYYLRVYLRMPRLQKNIEITHSLVIGTIPIQSTYETGRDLVTKVLESRVLEWSTLQYILKKFQHNPLGVYISHSK